MAKEANIGVGHLTARLGHYPRLSSREEQELAKRYRENNDTAAARTLVESHLRLVVSIARTCGRGRSSMPDLIQEGILGLMKAVTKYDPARGVRLSTYASWWIRAYIYQYTMANARVVRMVTTYPQRKLFFSLRRERSRMEAHGEPVEPQALAARLRVPVEDVVEMDARLSGKDVTLEGAGGDLAGASSWGGQERQAADEALASCQMRRAVRQKMEALEQTLDERERAIISQRLTADEPMTLGEVGRRFGISRERVRQLESRLKKRLQVHLRDVAPTSYEATAEA